VAAAEPVIIEAAINGLSNPADNPHVPVTPEQVARDALACIDAGAAIVHHHADAFGVTAAEAAERYLEAWRPVWAERPDALVYPTVHVDGGLISYEHLAPLAAAGMRTGLA
jgi:uncharacterized protein (DUF849 family)